MKYLGIYLPLSKREITLATFSMSDQYLTYVPGTYDRFVVISFLTLTIWFFFYALDIKIRGK
jgi:hypothetical protein